MKHTYTCFKKYAYNDINHVTASNEVVTYKRKNHRRKEEYPKWCLVPSSASRYLMIADKHQVCIYEIEIFCTTIIMKMIKNILFEVSMADQLSDNFCIFS